MKKLIAVLMFAWAVAMSVATVAGGWGTTPGAMYQDWAYQFEAQPPGEAPYTVRYLVTKGSVGFNQRQTVTGVLAAEAACQYGHDGITTASGDPWQGTGVPCVFTGAIPLVPESYRGATGSTFPPPAYP